MTSAFDPDDLVVDELLAGLDDEDADSLRPVLAELRGLAESEPVLPNRRLAGLLAAAAEANSAPSAATHSFETASLETVPGPVLDAPVTENAAAQDADAAGPTTWAPATASLAAMSLAATSLEAPLETDAADVVDLAAVRRTRGSAPRRRRTRPAVTALIVALTAGAATAGAAAVAQDGLHLWPKSSTTVVDGANGSESPSPSTTGQAPETRLAPAVPAPSTPAPSGTQAAPGITAESTKAAVPTAPAAPAPAVPSVPLPQLPISPPTLAPSPAPTVPQVMPSPTQRSLLPGLLPWVP